MLSFFSSSRIETGPEKALLRLCWSISHRGESLIGFRLFPEKMFVLSCMAQTPWHFVISHRFEVPSVEARRCSWSLLKGANVGGFHQELKRKTGNIMLVFNLPNLFGSCLVSLFCDWLQAYNKNSHLQSWFVLCHSMPTHSCACLLPAQWKSSFSSDQPPTLHFLQLLVPQCYMEDLTNALLQVGPI